MESRIEKTMHKDMEFYRLKSTEDITAVSWNTPDTKRFKNLIGSNVKTGVDNQLLINYLEKSYKMNTSSLMPNNNSDIFKEILIEYKKIVDKILIQIRTMMKNIDNIEISFSRFMNKRESASIWHKNYDENIYRCNCYIETQNYSSVDLLFNNKTIQADENLTHDSYKIRSNKDKDKVLSPNTNVMNTVLWNDKELFHRTPRDIPESGFPRSFIYFLIETSNIKTTQKNNIMIDNQTNFKNSVFRNVPLRNNSNLTNLNNEYDGGSNLIINISNKFTKHTLNNIARKMKLKNYNKLNKKELIKHIIKHI